MIRSLRGFVLLTLAVLSVACSGEKPPAERLVVIGRVDHVSQYSLEPKSDLIDDLYKSMYNEVTFSDGRTTTFLGNMNLSWYPLRDECYTFVLEKDAHEILYELSTTPRVSEKCKALPVEPIRRLPGGVWSNPYT